MKRTLQIQLFFFHFTILFINNISVFFSRSLSLFIRLFFLASIKQMGVAVLFRNISLDTDISGFFFSSFWPYIAVNVDEELNVISAKTLLNHNNITDRQRDRHSTVSLILTAWISSQIDNKRSPLALKRETNQISWNLHESLIMRSCVCGCGRALTNRLANKHNLFD